MMDVINILHDYWLILLIGPYPSGPIGGLALTIILAVVCLLASFPLSVVIGVARTSPIGFVSALATGYVSIIRAIPLLLLIFWSYFMVPVLTGHSVSGITTVICALIVYEISYLSEVIRSSIQSLPRGQVEASRSLGLGYFTTLRDVVLPQALFNAIPSILNQFISLVKNTSLAYIISVDELTYSAYQINSQLLTKPVQVYLILAACYFIICFSLNHAVGFVEKRISKSRQSPARVLVGNPEPVA